MWREPAGNLRQRALEALEKSTKLLKVAEQLASQGNFEESERLRDEGRTQRNISVWLMREARAAAMMAKNTRLKSSTGELRGQNVRA